MLLCTNRYIGRGIIYCFVSLFSRKSRKSCPFKSPATRQQSYLAWTIKICTFKKVEFFSFFVVVLKIDKLRKTFQGTKVIRENFCPSSPNFTRLKKTIRMKLLRGNSSQLILAQNFYTLKNWAFSVRNIWAFTAYIVLCDRLGTMLTFKLYVI